MLRRQGGPLPFVISHAAGECGVSLEADDKEFLVELWRQQAAIPRDKVEGGFVCVSGEESFGDERLAIMKRALEELEVGGPAGVPIWGPTGMKIRARNALVEAGFRSE